MSDQQLTAALIAAAQTVLSSAEIHITLEEGHVETRWTRDGETIAWANGAPRNLLNKLRGTEKLRCVLFSIYRWEPMLTGDLKELVGEMFEGMESQIFRNHLAEHLHFNVVRVNDALEEWVNGCELTAHKAEFRNYDSITRATWHASKKRWMFGPKQKRTNC